MIKKRKPHELTDSNKKDIKAFQRAEGLQVDGEVGRQTFYYAADLIKHLRKRIEMLQDECDDLMNGGGSGQAVMMRYLLTFGIGAAIGAVIAGMFG